jgi:hypothetical protein
MTDPLKFYRDMVTGASASDPFRSVREALETPTALNAGAVLGRVGRHDLASDYVERIRGQIDDFEKELAADEVSVIEVVLPDRAVVPYYFGYHNPDMVVIDGHITGSGRDVRLALPKHAVLLSLSKYKASELADDPPQRTIGFQERPDDEARPTSATSRSQSEG